VTSSPIEGSVRRLFRGGRGGEKACADKRTGRKWGDTQERDKRKKEKIERSTEEMEREKGIPKLITNPIGKERGMEWYFA